MSDIKKLLETMDRMSAAERKPAGPKFPGYWKGTDPASKAKDKMVGGAEESIIKDLHSTAKERVTEWQLQEKYARFKEQDSKAYTGIDPIVRQRMGMPPATADEIQSYFNKNPPAIKAGDGYLHSNTAVSLDPKKDFGPDAVRSGGQMDVISAAAGAAKKAAGINEPSVNVTDRPVQPVSSQAQPPASAVAPAARPQPPVSASSATSSSNNSTTDNFVKPPPGLILTPEPNKNNGASATSSGPNTQGQGMLSGGGSATWATSPLNPANRRDSSSAPAVAPFGSGPPDTRLLINPPQGNAALNPAKNTDSATNIPGGQSAGGPGVVPPAARPSSTATPYRGNQGAREIQAVNPSIKDVNKIQAGQRLKLPDSDKDYVVQKGDTLDKIGKMYRSGEIGGRVVGGEGPTSSSDSRPQPAAPAAAAQPAAPAARPQPAASGPQPAAPTARPAPAASGPQPAAPAAATQPNAGTSQTNLTHPPGTQVQLKIHNVKDRGKLVNGGKPMDITVMKGADGKWYNPKGQPVTFNKPSDLDHLERMPALQLPRITYDNPRPPGVPAGSMSTPNFLKAPLGSFQNYRKGSDGEWYREDGTRVDRLDLIQNLEKNAKTPQAPSARPQPAAPREPAGQTSKVPEASKSSDAMASYAARGGRVYAADFNNPSGLGWDGKGKYTSYKTPEEGVNATKDLVARYLTDQTPYIKGSPTPDQVVSTWVSGGKTPADKIQGGRYLQSVKDELAAAGVKLDAKGRIPYSQAARDAITRAIVRHETAPKHMEKFAPFLTAPKDAKGSIEESNKEDEKIAGRYDPDDFDLMVKRLGQRAREQDRKHGPVDIAALAKRLRELEKRHQTNEVEDPAVNMQDPDVQQTSQTSPQQDPAAVRQQQLDQTVDMATAKGTMTGLKNVLGPKVDTNALASAVTKISDGKPLSGPESMSMSALTPLISKAAETPQTAMALKTALSNAGMLAKQGK